MVEKLLNIDFFSLKIHLDKKNKIIGKFECIIHIVGKPSLNRI